MHENDDLTQKRDWVAPSWLVPALAMILAAATVWSVVALVNERTRSSALDSQNKTLAANLDGVQSQVRSLSKQLDTLTTAIQTQKQQAVETPTDIEQPAGQPLSIPTITPNRTAAHPPQAKPKPKPAVTAAKDPRIDEVQARLRDQQKELADTRQQIDKTRQDLEGNINSTKAELNGSLAHTNDSLAQTNDSLGRTNETVAKNHEELVELQKRGQRNYYEFTLDKSKDFQRVGPLSLSLRKANTKKRSYDFEMMVDDQKLQKKNVNLFEPVTIVTSDRGHAIQLVVNQVGKDLVRGYISEPKFKTPQVAAVGSSTSPTLQQRPQ